MTILHMKGIHSTLNCYSDKLSAYRIFTKRAMNFEAAYQAIAIGDQTRYNWSRRMYGFHAYYQIKLTDDYFEIDNRC